MIEVKEAKAAQEARAAAPFRVNVPIESKAKGWNDPFAFRDPAEMVTISADRFERLIRVTERVNQELGEYELKISRALDFINTVAMEWAEKGQQIPTYEDMFRMSEILGWVEPCDIRRTRERVAAEKAKAKREKEAANNGEATD